MEERIDLREVQEKWNECAQKLKQYWEQIVQAIRQALAPVGHWLSDMWRSLHRVNRRIRKKGTQREKRAMWRMMHPPSHHRRRGRHYA